MLAYIIDSLGAPGEIRGVPVPEPGEGQVRVRVQAAGVNPVDAFSAQGFMREMAEHRLPLIPGTDASGVVDAVGSGVVDVDPGDEVFGSAGKTYFGEGTYAEYAVMSAAAITRKPAKLSHAEAAALPTPGATALTLLDAAPVSAGRTVLVVGATGGVGSILVQLAAGHGATVIAVCRGENAEYARELGAAHVIDYTAGNTEEALAALRPGRISALLDTSGDKDLVTGLSTHLEPDGRVASCALGADEQTLTDRGLTAVNTMTMVTTAALTGMAEQIGQGRLRPPQLETLSLDQASAALDQALARHTRGKLILSMTG
ncbi:NADP-dependent oxidoreductase [Nonomuraea longispora]|uniref:NADP-dependent oxidoreductase n=1 Tax=Nonomuraea longispora TaxID=1848320 RepID=A0A4R4N066_9ACTN|nr:NADP-dependent oxidoreductase [Nonomuraea longispora]TDB99361.1 NADP-dependent oxidoreductase [Nonomuraea longispora]